MSLLCRRFSSHFPVCIHKNISKSARVKNEVCRRRRHLTTTTTVMQEEHILRSPYGENHLPEGSFSDFIFPYFEKHGQKTFLIDGLTGQSYSYHDSLRYSLKAAAALKKLGLRQGDVVGICSVNKPEFVIAWFALLSLGVVITEVNPSFSAREICNHLLQTGVKMLFVGEENAEVAREAIKSLPSIEKCIVFGKANGFIPFDQLMKTDEPISESLVDVDPKSIVHIPFSSGTSGLPKGVLMSHHSVIGSTQSTIHEGVRLNDEDDVTLLLLPMFHAFATIYTRTNIAIGCPIVMLPRFAPEPLLNAIQKYRVTVFPLVPPLVLFLTQSPLVDKYDLSSLKKISCGAAPVAPKHFESLVKKLQLQQLRQGYGLTELCPISMSPRAKGPYDLLDTVGYPSCGVELKIVEPESGKALPAGQKGEICARANYRMAGYLNNPKATDEMIDKESWLHTGDIGYVNEKGNLYVVDRLKELIKYKGHQVAPAELEALLLQHPGIKDAAVVGVPDEKAGELPKAFVVLKNSTDDISEKEIQKFVAEHAIDKNHLRGGVTFLQAIPKSNAGKILRKQLKNL